MSEIKLVEVKPVVDIKIIKETLCRIGIKNTKTKTLYPSCYFYENFGKYYIAHFKELFVLTRDNGYNNISEEDIIRRNAIIFCLKNWKLIEVLDESLIEPHNMYVFVLPHPEKKEWKIEHKFNSFSVGTPYNPEEE